MTWVFLQCGIGAFSLVKYLNNSFSNYIEKQILLRSWLYLFKLVGYHGKGLENSIRWPGDGDYPLRAVPLWDVDTSATLSKEEVQIMKPVHTSWELTKMGRDVLLTSSRIFFTVSPFWKKREETVLRCFISQRCCVALRGLCVVLVINTFPMMLPTSCRNTNTHTQNNVIC